MMVLLWIILERDRPDWQEIVFVLVALVVLYMIILAYGNISIDGFFTDNICTG